MSFEVMRHRASVQVLHGDSMIEPRRTIHLMQPDRAAVALGSAQRTDTIDTDAAGAAGLSLVRRRSGGGLVVIEPASMRWVDVVIPTGDPLWSDDVAEAFLWIGEAWAEALGRAGERAHAGEFVIHGHGHDHRALGRLVCFAGAGSGEVMDGAQKVVGISQRRTRTYARFQCLVHGAVDTALNAALVRPEALAAAGDPFVATRDELQSHLRAVVATVHDLEAVVAHLCEALNSR